jgi:S1-C subfamily serine protease
MIFGFLEFNGRIIMKKQIKICRVLFIAIIFLIPFHLIANDKIPTSATMTTDLAGRSGNLAVPSVFRVIIARLNIGGTAFLHKSGNAITVAHVVASCSPMDIQLIDYRGQKYTVEKIIKNEIIDLAILKIKEDIKIPALEISTNEKFSIGLQVSTWGFPGGYKGNRPLLLSGYLSGIEIFKMSGDIKVPRWVVNAAFNNGNSGGPLLDIENGKIIGVVSSKLAPLPSHIKSSLKALKGQRAGMVFTKTYKDGRKEKISQAQVIEEVLQYLRRQTQLVIGYAVMIEDLKKFLRSNGFDP